MLQCQQHLSRPRPHVQRMARASAGPHAAHARASASRAPRKRPSNDHIPVCNICRCRFITDFGSMCAPQHVSTAVSRLPSSPAASSLRLFFSSPRLETATAMPANLPAASAQAMPEEAKIIDVKANCFYIPHTCIGFFVRPRAAAAEGAAEGAGAR